MKRPISFLDFSLCLNRINSEPSSIKKNEIFRTFLNTTLVSSEELLIIIRLLNLKENKIHTGFSETIEKINIETISKPSLSEKTIIEIYNIILNLAKIQGRGSITNKKKILAEIFSELDSVSRTFLSRIISNNLRIGFSDMSLKNILIERGVFDNRITKLQFNLAKKFPTRPSSKLFNGVRKYYLENKFDGIRILIFLFPDKKIIYTRRGEDISDKLVSFPSLELLRQELVLDCELTLPEFSSFSKKLRSKEFNLEGYHLQVFDILKVGKKNLETQPLYIRKKILELEYSKLPIALKKISSLVKGELVSPDYEKVLDILEKKISILPLEIEGLMLKSAQDSYKAGNRSWFKIKRKKETLDLIVMKRVLGKGKFREKYSSFNLGLKNEEETIFLCSVGSGFKEEDLLFFEKNFSWTKDYPQEQIIMEVSFQEVISSSTNKTGYSLRFPIFQRYRLDLKEPSSLEFLKQLV